MHIRNNKGSFYALIVAVGILLAGSLMYISMDAAFTGAGNNTTGIYYVAENNLNITSASPDYGTYTVLKNIWLLIPMAILIAVFLKVFSDSQRRGAYE